MARRAMKAKRAAAVTFLHRTGNADLLPILGLDGIDEPVFIDGKRVCPHCRKPYRDDGRTSCRRPYCPAGPASRVRPSGGLTRA